MLSPPPSPPPSRGLERLTDPRRVLVAPTLDEVAAIPALADLADDVLDRGVVDRVVVLDGGSSDGTVAAARAAGLEVVAAADQEPGPPVLGKGDSLWRAADLDADVLVFRDADVTGVDAVEIDRLVTAACRPGVALAKGHFERLQYADGPPRPSSGRVTEFVARPLLALLAPELAHLPEPLSGQVAVRAEVFASLEVVTRYGVDVGLVFDVARRHGVAAIASVDLGALSHHSKADASLVAMAHDVAATILSRCGHLAATAADGEPAVAARLPCGGAAGTLVVRPPRRGGAATRPVAVRERWEHP